MAVIKIVKCSLDQVTLSFTLRHVLTSEPLNNQILGRNSQTCTDQKWNVFATSGNMITVQYAKHTSRPPSVHSSLVPQRRRHLKIRFVRKNE